jgi:hypothetical protein
MRITPYHAKYFAYQLSKRNSSDSIEKFASTLVDARVDLNPHQVEAALFAFRSPLSKGAILADEVGLGKTIEAGLVIAQLWAERKRRILIITPANLRKQWSQELADKFLLPTLILETKSFVVLKKQGYSNPFDTTQRQPIQDSIVLCSYKLRAGRKHPNTKSQTNDTTNADDDGTNAYRPRHPLALWVVEQCRSLATPTAELIFDYAGHDGKISLFEQTAFQSGWMRVAMLRFSYFEEAQDIFLLSAITDDGQILDEDVANRFFALPASVGNHCEISQTIAKRLSEIEAEKNATHRAAIQERNTVWFRDEAAKLDAWASDRTRAVEDEIDTVKRRLKELNRKQPHAATAQEQLDIQQEILMLKSKQNKLRATLFSAEDEIQEKRRTMIDDIKQRMTLTALAMPLFDVRWRIVPKRNTSINSTSQQ